MSLDVDNTELYLKDESKVDTDLTLLDDIIAPSDDNIPDIGKLAYHGILSGSVSYHGNSPEMLRRCLDLSILRSDIKTGRWCVLELDRFKEVGGEPLRTNLVNRLICAIPKYIGNDSPINVLLIDKLVERWTTVRYQDSNEGRCLVLQMLELLLISPRSTYLLEYQKVYHDILDYPELIKNDNFKEFCQDYDSFPDDAHGCWELATEVDPPELVCLMDGFCYQFQQGNSNVYYWLFQIIDMGNLKVRASQRYRRYRPEYAVFEYLFTRDTDDMTSNILGVLFNWYRNRLDPSLYLIQSVDLVFKFCKDGSKSNLDKSDVLTSLEDKIDTLSPSESETLTYDNESRTDTIDIKDYLAKHRDYRIMSDTPFQELLTAISEKQTHRKKSGKKTGRKKKQSNNYMETDELVADIPPIEE